MALLAAASFGYVDLKRKDFSRKNITHKIWLCLESVFCGFSLIFLIYSKIKKGLYI